MTLLVERKLPGEPISREQLVAEWEDLHHRNLMKGPVASFLFDIHYSVPEKMYQWRMQLDRQLPSRCRRSSRRGHPTRRGRRAMVRRTSQSRDPRPPIAWIARLNRTC